MADCVDHVMEKVELPSEWAERKFEETGDTAYLELYNLWKEKGQ